MFHHNPVWSKIEEHQWLQRKTGYLVANLDYFKAIKDVREWFLEKDDWCFELAPSIGCRWKETERDLLRE